MGYIQDLVNAGYGGYQGWNDEAAARADFQATGGRGKETSTGTSSGGAAAAPISADDFSKLEESAFQMSKPYYLQLATESRGDFSRALQIMEEDYTRGVRQAKEDNARKVFQENEDFKANLAKLGVSLTGEQEQKIDELNRRGMAVGEMQNGEFNVLRPETITTSNEGLPTEINTPANPTTIGRGGTELNKLVQDQALRQEALQRTKNRNIQELGLSLKRYTNTPEGVTDISKPNVDRSQLGEAELSKVRGVEDLTRQQQLKEQGLFEQRRKEAFGAAQGFAGLQTKAIPTSLANRYLQNTTNSWIATGA